MDDIQTIQQAIRANHLQEAMTMIGQKFQEKAESATLYYLQGIIYMKRSQWSQAMTSFLHAESLDPQSPACQCRHMLSDIMNFYNKDMYNQ